MQCCHARFDPALHCSRPWGVCLKAACVFVFLCAITCGDCARAKRNAHEGRRSGRRHRGRRWCYRLGRHRPPATDFVEFIFTHTHTHTAGSRRLRNSRTGFVFRNYREHTHTHELETHNQHRQETEREVALIMITRFSDGGRKHNHMPPGYRQKNATGSIDKGTRYLMANITMAAGKEK